MDFYTTAQSIKLTPAERETVKSAQAKIAAAGTFASPFNATGLDGEPSQSQLKMRELTRQFMSAPSAKLADELAQLALFHENSKAISGHFEGIVSAVREETSRALLPLAQSLTARAIAALDQQLDLAVTSLQKVGGLQDSIAELRARHARQVQIGNYDCAETVARHEVLPWISNNFGVA